MGYIEELRNLVGTRPLILVGSAVIILNEKQEVLLQYRSDTYDWGVPGGAMELGETTKETARRELLEETGLEAETLQFLGVLSGKELYYRYPNGDEIFNVINLFQAYHVIGKMKCDEEGLDIRYFPADKLPKLNKTTEKILQKFLYALTE
ncbi:NUDIX hydrolase [Bacillus sp. DX1.1]|uniref:NUDIX hydrolase n=1 Tax=unclassified Bacillus (in: firmicutes) TaxID=185979 RepID=UPI0025709384|nr:MULTISPECIES: NUDIX hydrolase [unclassified Bacillus (in: firmicutes)]MDM5156216.1 NUDIX hydrolase [Bacillus sp. DX1.1]WJE80495.1 NUDIX hydrolase [Bacillus sp. DX3.1]